MLFDNLDYELTDQCLIGLFKLMDRDLLDVHKGIKTKVFLDEQRWERLEYSGKTRFKGKTINLIWNRVDFLRLTLRYLISIPEFETGLQELKYDLNIDKMEESKLKEVLHIIWGIRIEEIKFSMRIADWIFTRLQDTQGSTYPESVYVFLRKAVRYQLQNLAIGQENKLLSFEAIKAGLREASKERWDVVKKTYFYDSEVLDLFTTDVVDRDGKFKYATMLGLIKDGKELKALLSHMNHLKMILDFRYLLSTREQKYELDEGDIEFAFAFRPIEFSGLYRGVFDLVE